MKVIEQGYSLSEEEYQSIIKKEENGKVVYILPHMGKRSKNNTYLPKEDLIEVIKTFNSKKNMAKHLSVSIQTLDKSLLKHFSTKKIKELIIMHPTLFTS